jgi:Eukaryotic-type carbonic anhydrase
VHFKSEYGDANEAKTHPDGLAVFGVLFVVKIGIKQILIVLQNYGTCSFILFMFY